LTMTAKSPWAAAGGRKARLAKKVINKTEIDRALM
jgi:hypothetical protein